MGLFSKVIVSCKHVLIQRQPWNTYRAYASGFLMSIFLLIDMLSDSSFTGSGKLKLYFHFKQNSLRSYQILIWIDIIVSRGSFLVTLNISVVNIWRLRLCNSKFLLYGWMHFILFMRKQNNCAFF